jgi:hypothetical protein
MGLLSATDARDFVRRREADRLSGLLRHAQIAGRLWESGHKLSKASAAVASNGAAVTQARPVAGSRPGLTIFAYPVAQFSTLASPPRGARGDAIGPSPNWLNICPWRYRRSVFAKLRPTVEELLG